MNGADANVGFTINYVDDRLGETIDPTYRLPEYTLVNLFGLHQLNDQVKLTMNIDNLLDREVLRQFLPQMVDYSLAQIFG